MTLTAHFGSKGTYYRYKDGERWINPELQRKIQDLVRLCGSNTEVTFDEYADTYDFTIAI